MPLPDDEHDYSSENFAHSIAVGIAAMFYVVVFVFHYFVRTPKL